MNPSLHPDDERLFRAVAAGIGQIAPQFGIELQGVKPMAKQRCRGFLGEACLETNVIWIAVRNVSPKGFWLPKPYLTYQILETIGHEVAHLAAGFFHTANFFKVNVDALALACNYGLYEKLERARRP